MISKLSHVIAAMAICLALLGCASTKGAKTPVSQDSNPAVEAEAKNSPDKKIAEPLPSAEDSKQKRNDEEISMPEIRRSLLKKQLPKKVEHEPVAFDLKKIAHADGNMLLNAEAMPLSDFVIYALGDTLKVTFFMDEQVKNMKNPITLRMTTEMPAEKVLEIVIGFLERNDLSVEERGGALYILKPKQVAEAPVDYRIGRDIESSPATVVQIVSLKNMLVMEAIHVLGPLYKNVKMEQYIRENLLMLTGPAASIKEVINFIDFIDVPTMREKKLFLAHLTYWQPDEFIAQITRIMEGVGLAVAKVPKDPGVLFITIKYINSVLIVSPDEATLKFIMEWRGRLDTAESAGSEEKAFTFRPNYSKASDLVDSIKKLYGIMPAAAVAPPKGAAAPPPASPAGGVPVPGLKIASDDTRNIVLLISTPANFKSFLAILQEMDKPPKQVLIEATIAELTLKDDLSYGLEWYIKNKMSSGTSTASTLGQLGLNASGLTYKFIADSQKFQAAVSAFAQQNRINILATPRIMVVDNHDASIQVGTDVPILSSQTTTTTTEGASVNSQAVQYRNTGILLTVKPTINTEGTLSLTISLEDSEAQSNSVSSINTPIVLTRRLNTSIIATTSQTIILGGMMSSNISYTDNRVPILGDVPLLGNLFKSTSRSKTKTELIIMLTPHILSNGDEAAKVTDEIKKGLKWFQ
jgi:general secretion pathway protein D